MESKNEEVKKNDSHSSKQSPKEVNLTENSSKSSESTSSKQKSPLLFLTRRMKGKKKRESGFSDGDYETTIEEEGPDPSADVEIVKSAECTKVAKGKLKKGSKSISKVFKYRPKIRKSISAPADVRREMDHPSEMTTVIDDSESISSYTTPYEVSSSGYNTPLQLESSAETPETSQSLTESLVDEGEASLVEKTPKIPNTEALAKTMEALQVLHEAPVDSRISDVKHETIETNLYHPEETAPLASSESSLSYQLEEISSEKKDFNRIQVHDQDVSTVQVVQPLDGDQVTFGQRSNHDPSSATPSTLLQSSISFRGSNSTGAKPKSSSLPERPTTEEIRFYFTEYNNGHTLPDSDKQESFIRSLPPDTNRMDNSSNTETNGYLKNEHLYKVLVIGELGTGKTSIIKRYVHQFFSQHYRATIGVDFALKVVHWDQNTVIRLQLWDIAGQERFGNMTRVYYKEAVGAFVVFDVTRSSTFDSVAKWKQDLDAKVQLPDGSPLPCVLLANKCDQPKEGIAANTAKLDEYCKEKGFAGWFETSAKDNINIDEAAKFLVGKILENDKWSTSMKSEDADKFDLNKQSREKKKGCC